MSRVSDELSSDLRGVSACFESLKDAVRRDRLGDAAEHAESLCQWSESLAENARLLAGEISHEHARRFAE